MVFSIGSAKEDLLPYVPSYGWQAILKNRMMYYTYVIESISHPENRYIGHTSDLKQRVAEHNAGRCDHTAKFASWKLKIYTAFETLEQAQHFERYLKSGSGHAFADRHFWQTEPD
jgi:predicted GIY-YIG superfamily endonuclease